MSATAPVRSYRVLRRTKIAGQRYDPKVAESQFYIPRSDVSEQTLQAMVSAGHIENYFGELPAEVAIPAETSAPSTSNRAARKEAAKGKQGKTAAEKREAKTTPQRGSTPQRAAATRDDNKADGAGKVGEVKETDEPITGDKLRQSPGTGLPSGDPGKPGNPDPEPGAAQPGAGTGGAVDDATPNTGGGSSETTDDDGTGDGGDGDKSPVPPDDLVAL